MATKRIGRLTFRISPDLARTVEKLAAERTIRTGNRCSSSEWLREAVNEKIKRERR